MKNMKDNIKIFKLMTLCCCFWITLNMTIDEVEHSPYSLYFYSENYLIKKFKEDKRKSNLYFIATKIKTISAYKNKNYMNLLKEVSKSNDEFKINDKHEQILLSKYAEKQLKILEN